MGVLAMLAKGFFDFMTVAVVADLLSLTSICAIIIAVDAAFGVDFLSDAIARPFDVAFTDFNDSLSGGICQCVVADVPCSSAGLTPAKPGHAGACAVCPAAGGADKVSQLLAGLPELHGTGGGVHPGLCFGQIPALILAHGALPGPLHLADLVLGVFFSAVLDVPGVELFKALLRPGRRCAQLREDGEKGVAAVPAAQPCSGAVAGGGFKLAADGVGCRDSAKRHTAGKICVSLRLMGQMLCYTSDSDPMISQSRAVSGVLSEPPGCFMGDILLEGGTGKMILFYIAVFFAAFFGRLLKK